MGVMKRPLIRHAYRPGGSRRTLPILLGCLVGCVLTGCRERTRGSAPTLGKPMRVVSTMVAADEILLELIGPKRLVAVSRFGAQPSWSLAAGRIRRIPGRIHTVSAEAVLTHRPDLCVLADYAQAETALVLKRAGVRVVRLKSVNALDDIRHNIRLLSKAVHAPAAAAELLAYLDRHTAALRDWVSRRSSRPEVMSAHRGFLAGTHTLFDELLRLAGGRNVARRLAIRGHVRVDTEVLWRANPQYVLLQAETQTEALAAARADPSLAKLSAVKAGRVLFLPRAQLSCASHHIVRSLWTLFSQLHPSLARKHTPPPPTSHRGAGP